MQTRMNSAIFILILICARAWATPVQPVQGSGQDGSGIGIEQLEDSRPLGGSEQDGSGPPHLLPTEPSIASGSKEVEILIPLVTEVCLMWQCTFVVCGPHC